MADSCCGRFGWRTLIEYDDFPLGLNEDVVRAISAKKSEPEWLLDFRLRAYRRWLTMKEPAWSDNRCGAARTLFVAHVHTWGSRVYPMSANPAL